MDTDALTLIGQVGSIGTAIGTIALVFLFWKTVKGLEETVKLAKIQANYRFRPWIGHVKNIEFMSSSDGKDKFSITIKNYGEIPSDNTVAKFVSSTNLLKKEELESSKTSSFKLGPLLPNMEKRYWFFIDSSLMSKAKSGEAEVFTLLYFSYEYHGGKNGYGLISKYDKASDIFVHTDMWID
jgi:hypothetical protein